jgi:hypothetical protein
MTQDVASPLEDRLRAALTEVAEHVSVDQLPATWTDEDVHPAPSRRVRVFAVAALAASLAAGVAIAVNETGSSSVSHPAPASSTTTPTEPPPLALTCPSRPPNSVDSHQVAGTETTMVPGTPTALLACRYHGSNQPEPLGSLAQSARFDPGPIAAALNAQPVALPVPCPSGTGDDILLLFAYADGSRLSILAETSGCQFAMNGDRLIRIDPTTLEQLQAVLGKESSP